MPEEIVTKLVNRSFTGCYTCRHRKIKCDEERPKCSNCIARNLDCSWYQFRQEFLEQTLSSTNTSASIRKNPSLHVDVNNLELIHHWTTVTASNICIRPGVADVLSQYAPSLAVAHPFLMHILLAIAALDLDDRYRRNSSVLTKQVLQYRERAQAHFEAGMQSLTNVYNHRESADVDVFYLAYNAIIIYLVCNTDEHIDSPMVFQWIHVARNGISHMMEMQQQTSAQLKPLTNITTDGATFITAPTCSYLPSYLTDLIAPSALPPDVAELADPVVAETYRDALAKLHESWQLVWYPQFHENVACIWPTAISDKFVKLLIEGRPRAMVLLAHYYGVVLMVDTGSFWPPSHKFRINYSTIIDPLGEVWTPYLGWPSRIWAVSSVSPIITRNGFNYPT